MASFSDTEDDWGVLETPTSSSGENEQQRQTELDLQSRVESLRKVKNSLEKQIYSLRCQLNLKDESIISLTQRLNVLQAADREERSRHLEAMKMMMDVLSAVLSLQKQVNGMDTGFKEYKSSTDGRLAELVKDMATKNEHLLEEIDGRLGRHSECMKTLEGRKQRLEMGERDHVDARNKELIASLVDMMKGFDGQISPDECSVSSATGSFKTNLDRIERFKGAFFGSLESRVKKFERQYGSFKEENWNLSVWGTANKEVYEHDLRQKVLTYNFNTRAESLGAGLHCLKDALESMNSEISSLEGRVDIVRKETEHPRNTKLKRWG